MHGGGTNYPDVDGRTFSPHLCRRQRAYGDRRAVTVTVGECDSAAGTSAEVSNIAFLTVYEYSVRYDYRGGVVNGSGIAANTSSVESFRDVVHEWLLEHCPPSMREPIRDESERVFAGRRGFFPSDDARAWLAAMSARGWTAPTWPREYGGGGLSDQDARTLARELRAMGCRPPLISPQGLHMLGPALLKFGSEQQKRRFLPAIAAGAERWCQGFSEPNAGSDLAAVRCRAERVGDEYIVIGEKVWTSFADESDWIFAVVRTDPAESGRSGTSVLLIDLASQGITIRPLPLLSGPSEYSHIHFGSVRVPAEQRLGEENEGWEIVRFVLAHERNMLGTDASGTLTSGRRPNLVAMARGVLRCDSGPLPDAALRDRITQITFDEICTRAMRQRIGAAPVNPAVLKYCMSNLNQRKADLRARIAGNSALGMAGVVFDDADRRLAADYLESRGWTIGGGTSEVNLNAIARGVLKLPHRGPEVRR
ncbi:MAG: acyl-CoA dehydrogenase family protein [Mycobacterium sp.]|uniref:acyl-CoA dehydrogenase family protein n=1 Tax=Mycobacterium sp. TaxID=1785 RepID=UPI003C562DFC